MRQWRFIAVILGMALVVLFGVRFLVPKGGKGFFQGGQKKLYEEAKESFSRGNNDEALRLYTQLATRNPSSDLVDEGYLGIGDVQFEKENLLEARGAYEKIVRDFPNSNSAALVQDRLGKVNIAALFSPIATPADKTVQVQPGETLAKIAKAQGTTVDLLIRSNHLKSDLIRPGMKLKVPGARFSIVIDKSQNTLALKAGEEIFKVYSVATGAHNSTPVGNFKIVNKLVNPVWYTLGAVVPAESSENVLGTRWLGIDVPGYGIHGTKDPSSIGKQGTQGCVRMFNGDVEEIYAIVPIGTEITIID